jgi:hypothetical protein
MFTRMAAVMEYVESEHEIRSDEDRQQLVLFLRDLHSAFCNRLENGESLETITFPPEILEEYGADFEGRFPSRLVIERLRSQFDDYERA